MQRYRFPPVAALRLAARASLALRTVCLPACFVDDPFRRGRIRAVPRGRTVTALKSAISTGRTAPCTPSSAAQHIATGDVLGVGTNIVSAENTVRLRVASQRRTARRRTTAPAALITRIAPPRCDT